MILRESLFHWKFLSTFFINFDPDLTQTQILTLKFTPKLTQILTLKKHQNKTHLSHNLNQPLIVRKMTTNGIPIHAQNNQRHAMASKLQQFFNAGQA